jgi:hypothetical protein
MPSRTLLISLLLQAFRLQPASTLLQPASKDLLQSLGCWTPLDFRNQESGVAFCAKLLISAFFITKIIDPPKNRSIPLLECAARYLINVALRHQRALGSYKVSIAIKGASSSSAERWHPLSPRTC